MQHNTRDFLGRYRHAIYEFEKIQWTSESTLSFPATTA